MTARRPRTIPELQACLGRFRSEESLRRGQGISVRDDDLFISTYPKCGTTWLQQIVHGLRTGGDMGFGEICEVVPWLESAVDLGQDPDAEQVAQPRAFKSHLAYEDLPEGGRRIYCIRDPQDVLVSFFRFFEGWMFETGSIDIETFGHDFFLGGSNSGRYWDHLRSWWAHRNESDVLILAFEDLKADLSGAVKTIARFMGAPNDHRAIATEQATFAFMSAHGSQFDDHFLRRHLDPKLGLPPGGETTKVRAGRSGEGRTLPPSLLDALNETWAQEIAGPLGFTEYAELRRALRG